MRKTLCIFSIFMLSMTFGVIAQQFVEVPVSMKGINFTLKVPASFGGIQPNTTDTVLARLKPDDPEWWKEDRSSYGVVAVLTNNRNTAKYFDVTANAKMSQSETTLFLSSYESVNLDNENPLHQKILSGVKVARAQRPQPKPVVASKRYQKGQEPVVLEWSHNDQAANIFWRRVEGPVIGNTLVSKDSLFLVHDYENQRTVMVETDGGKVSCLSVNWADSTADLYSHADTVIRKWEAAKNWQTIRQGPTGFWKSIKSCNCSRDPFRSADPGIDRWFLIKIEQWQSLLPIGVSFAVDGKKITKLSKYYYQVKMGRKTYDVRWE